MGCIFFGWIVDLAGSQQQQTRGIARVLLSGCRASCSICASSCTLSSSLVIFPWLILGGLGGEWWVVVGSGWFAVRCSQPPEKVLP